MNKLDKTKSPIAFSEEIKKLAENLMEEFKHYTTGYRVLFLIHRNKEGGETNNTKYRKIITRNREEYKAALLGLLIEKSQTDIPYRIYASVNERNINKAIRRFKYEQLEADYYDQIQKENFYLDLKNRFIGCLMQPPQRATSYFLFDVDNEEGRDVMGETLQVLPNEMILQTYPTKNGWHIITKPFDYTKIKLPNGCSINKDGLLLLAW